ncbi:myotubularin-related protein 4-like isoform X2 [Musca domestica]|uniref:phosphatidylinositol-3,5-bisphosphate 3-phosphatase n=1 Tax=Musca domestica TaxID=7370 RepID=A0ABM3UXX1_MUSDO|nr:myotubularin-related protein 4-like isoform X2 [Musca domestica]
MEASDGSPPPSLCMVRAAELFPKPQMEKEDTELKVPFQELAGESVKYLGRTDDGILALSNYRLYLQKTSTNVETSVPLGLIESAQSRDLFHLIVYCKDASTVKCSFETAEQCTEWQRRIQMSVGVPETLESIFAFPFCSWACDSLNGGGGGGVGAAGVAGGGGGGVAGGGGSQTFNSNTENPGYNPYLALDYNERLQKCSYRYEDDFMREVERLGFDLNGPWRISRANEDFKLCPSYPPKLLVPCCISDETLNNVANFRGSRRLPAVVWRHRKSGAVIARCSQPEVGWLGWRNTKDEQLLKALADACAFDRGEQMRQFANNSQSAQSIQIPSGDSSPSSPDGSHEEVALDEVRKILIVDARSYTSAVTNRARGGGCECIEYYPCAEIEFMNLGNIHVIRKSFHALRQLCASPPDVPNWLGLLEKTMWLQHLSGLLAASMTVCHAIEKKGRPVLVHCSDGWDRTPQIVATAQLCLDPYYRTIEGFRVLVEREWLSYGHKFADRCGHGPGSEELNERCPVFLQWLDLVHQIHKQFSCSFEFSMGYLIKLAQHSHSGLFGNFLCNTLKERLENSVFERTFSVWSLLSSPIYRNPLYKPQREKVLWPAHNVRDLSLWTEVYLGSLVGGNQNSIDFPNYINDTLMGSMSSMSKTRSYGDLITAGFIQNSMSRRSSDPNMTVDPNLTIGSNSENNSIADLQSDEREESPDILANLIHDTTRKLENLTNELNNHDNDDFKLASKHANESEHLDDDDHEEESKKPKTAMTITGSSNGIVHSSEQQQQQNTGCDNETTRTTTTPNTQGPSTPTSKKTKIVAKDASRDGGGNDVTDSSLTNGVNGIQRSSNGITIEKHTTMGLDLMMRSVAMDDDASCNHSLETSCNGSMAGESMTSSKTTTDESHNLWHGSINTSTDTLVPLAETKIQNGNCDTIDGGGAGKRDAISPKKLNVDSTNNGEEKTTKSGSTTCKILPKVHSSNNINSITSRPNQLSTSSLNTTTTNGNNNLHNATTTTTDDITTTSKGGDNKPSSRLTSDIVAAASASAGMMEESILILPEHRKLEISISGKCETVASNTTTSSGSNSIITSTNQQMPMAAPPPPPPAAGCPLSSSALPTPTSASTMSAYNLPYAINNSSSVPNNTAIPTNTTTAASSQRRRRTSSSNSGFIAKQANGSYISRFSLPGGGVRSLPMTPPGLTERQQVTISCPDGLAHALSEENIRLQQIVHEHKMREDVLLRELHDMRMALLKKICPNCNNANASANTDEQKIHFDNTTNLPPHRRRFCVPTMPMYQANRQFLKRYRRRRRRHQRMFCHSRIPATATIIIEHIDNCREENDDDNDDNDFDYELEEDDYDDDYSDSCNGDNEDAETYSVSGCSALDNVENASICSWEAVEDRSASGPSSCATTSSSMQPNATSVLWVPDHAVSRCTSCQTEFWLGRRKHHCRSCGQIFCADCSEYWAPLPDAKLFSPVRLCGPCHATTTRTMQQVSSEMMPSSTPPAVAAAAAAATVAVSNNSTNMHLQQNATKPAAASKA